MATRRPSLQPMSSSTLNSRASLGPSRVSQPADKKRMTMGAGDAARASMSGRPSLAPRRSSVMGKPTTTKQDPRPITDKAYRDSCVRSLITYLTEHGYDHALSPKILSAPTSKDFQNIISFLTRKIDPNFKGFTKFEDEVPQIFKKLQYPFPISKTSLQAVGSMHTWPALLAALAWLVELLMYDETVQQNEAGLEDGDAASVKMFFEYLQRAYTGFLAGEDNFSTLDENFQMDFEQKRLALDKEIEQLKSSNSELLAEITKIKCEPSPCEQLTTKKADFECDLEKFQKLLVNLEGHQQNIVKKNQEKEMELRSKEEELQEVLASKAELASQVAEQDSSGVDVQRISVDRSQLHDSAAAAATHKEQAEQAAYHHESEFNKKMEEIEQLVQQYTDLTFRLRIAPRDAKHASGLDLELPVHGTDKISDYLALDIKGSIKPALQTLRESYVQKIHAAQEVSIDTQGQLDRLSEQLSDKKDELRALESQLKKLETSHSMQKEAMESEVQSTLAEMQTVQARTEQLRGNATAQIAKAKAQVDQLQEEYNVLCAKCEAEEKSSYDNLCTALSLLAQHKEHIEQNLQELNQRCTGVLHQIESMQ